ncbi:MAG: nucleotidyltransferase family protein [bacterium]|nr:nucleotidyltransferase family protein [bacterium]
MSLQENTKNLINCCISVITGQHKPVDISDFNSFFSFCLVHKLENIACLYLSESAASDNTVMLLFKDKYKQAIHNDAAQQYYLSRIQEAFAENGINYLLLKGCVMKGLYPSSDLRQSADMDIYIGKENTLKAKPIMESLGFKNITFSDGESTDNYKADKFSYVELHKKLISDDYPWKNECNKILDRLIPAGNHEYVMNNEDFYIFMICHIAKHMKWGGIGIRAILDVWVYIRHYSNMDWDSIRSVLEKCSLTKFHENLLKLIDYWFEEKEADKGIKKLGLYIASSGWNGFDSQMKSSSIDKLAGPTSSKSYLKLKWYLNAAFMNRAVMSERYPILKKTPVLLPFCWIHRAAYAVLNKRDTINSVLHYYDSIDIRESKEINEFRREIGL